MEGDERFRELIDRSFVEEVSEEERQLIDDHKWRAKGAEFVTPPIDRGAEIRCYVRDPDGYLIEVGQSTGLLHGQFAAKRPEDLPG